MVDTDELDKVLESNSIKSCPDDETIERVPKGHLDWLYQENARLAKINDDLREEIYSHVQWEKELNDDFTKITRSFSLEHPIYKAVDIRTSVYNLVKNLEKNKGKIRLLGVTVSNLS